jgi:hypothetical protein
MGKGKYRLRGIYGKPLVKGTPLEDEADRTKLLEETGREAIKEVQKEISRLSFKGQPTDLLNSFTYEVEGKSTLVLSSDHPAAKYLNRGVKPHQMKYLEGATVPIVTDDGEVKFRTATPKSMRDGKWQHPGIKGKHFLERGVEKAREKIKQKVAEDIKERIKKRFRGE